MNRPKQILVLGSRGFIGTHLSERASAIDSLTICGIDIGYDVDELKGLCRSCDGVVHLAGLMRPNDPNDFSTVNDGLTQELIRFLREHHNPCPIIFSSSIQAALNNPYGLAKRQCEQMLMDLQSNNGNPVYIYRLSNAFGPHGRPNYNSVLATFCHNILRDEPIYIRDKDCVVPFVYVEDIVDTFIKALTGKLNPSTDQWNIVEPIYPRSLGVLADTITKMKPYALQAKPYPCADEFERKLFVTLLSYVPKSNA